MSVYVLRHTAQAREDFEMAGDGDSRHEWPGVHPGGRGPHLRTRTDICEAFRQARSDDYEALRLKAQDLAREIPRALTGAARQNFQRSLRTFRDELARIQAIDFCGAATRAAAEEAIDALGAKLTSGASGPSRALPALRREQYQPPRLG
jgi:hypothetical protein